ncbi:P-loop containing nucleoside triphosphate hydrolase protein [Scheffersomyces amazonensis]|uniref:P-loop containing nucleoside triphosphate hydrolase protein n=1 Tax=Scheffersomyces amazonensis TaxID=1078765 RepID=UPI00315D6CF0
MSHLLFQNQDSAIDASSASVYDNDDDDSSTIKNFNNNQENQEDFSDYQTESDFTGHDHPIDLQRLHDLIDDENDINQDELTDMENPDQSLPEHACAYCGIHNIESVVKCHTCNKWFCNDKSDSGGSHIVTHLVLSRHNQISLHEDSDLGDSVLECYNCGNKNVFILGFVSAKQESVVVILCRIPCAQMKDVSWDTSQWQSLIEDRQLLSWVAAHPTEHDKVGARLVTSEQITKLEAQWRLNRHATISDITEVDDAQEDILPILMRYNDAFQYQQSFAPLVQLEADYDKNLKESQALEHIQVKWAIGLNDRHLASFTLSTFDTNELKVAVGDEIILRYSGLNNEPWEGNGYIIRLPSSHQEEFTLELIPNRTTPPTTLTTDFTAEFVWKGTSYDRMQNAMKCFAVDEASVSGYIYHKLLGHAVAPVEFDIALPKRLSHPNLTELNFSQTNAVRAVLQRPLSLIQGPPGTGKTVTSATIIYHLSKLNKEKILVCAPSNVAVDHLAAKLDSLGLKVVRLTAKSREDVESSISHLSLHNIVNDTARGELKKLLRLRNEIGELSGADSRTLIKSIRNAESKILNKCDVVCCTCIGAGDKRLSQFKFRTVLIDESTQASEPEVLIPIVKGAKQVILVGDHQQLGPVILDKRAAQAGLRQSLFERLVLLGHVPIRLEVQYRMHPGLSEFPSNMFYEGSLQNGVTADDRRIINSTFPWPVVETPMMFWANYGREEIGVSGSSYLNRVEAMNVEKIITRLFKDGVSPDQIGVITPYEGQRAYIVQYMLMNSTLIDKKKEYSEVEVTSVDAFQGREKDFIILSCVRGNQAQQIGFLRDPRRLNVALTRAKYGLIILGNPRTLSRNSLWNFLLIHFRERGTLVEGPLDNLQMSMVQLSGGTEGKFSGSGNNKSLNGKPESYKPFAAPSTIGGISTDFDSASILSYEPGSTIAGNRTQEHLDEGGQWPRLGKVGDEHNNTYDENNFSITSNFFQKLQQNNNNNSNNNNNNNSNNNNGSSSQRSGHLDQKRIEDDIKSVTTSFINGLFL